MTPNKRTSAVFCGQVLAKWLQNNKIFTKSQKIRCVPATTGKNLNNREEIRIGTITYMRIEKDTVSLLTIRNLDYRIKIRLVHRWFRNKLLSLTKKMIPRRIITSIIRAIINSRISMKLRQIMSMINHKIALKEMIRNLSSKIMDPIFRSLINILKRKSNNLTQVKWTHQSTQAQCKIMANSNKTN